MKLRPQTIASLKNGHQACLKAAEKARGEHAFHATKAAEHAVKMRERFAEAEDYAEILRRADAAEPVHEQPTPAVSSSFDMVAAIHAVAALLSTAGLPAELGTQRDPRLDLRFDVGSQEAAEQLATAIKATGGAWHVGRPSERNPEHRWIYITRYGKGLDLEIHLDWPEAAAPETAPEASPVDETEASAQ